MKVLGIDPGKQGAFALYDSDTGAVVQIWEMPTYSKAFGTGSKTKERDELDKVGLIGVFDQIGPVDYAVMELVGQRPTQFGKAQAGMFAFGHAYGCVDMLLIVYHLKTERVRPQTWKKDLKCPADKRETVMRADELLPAHRALWRGPRGGFKDGIAEAALIAYWWAENLKKPAVASVSKRKAVVPSLILS